MSLIVETVREGSLWLHSRAKGIAFKGVANPESFRFYFNSGGISGGVFHGRDSGRPWVATDWDRALEYTHSNVDNFCFLVLDRRAVTRRSNNLVKTGSRSQTTSDYMGRETFFWNEVRAVMVSSESLMKIKGVYDNCKDPTISWEDFERKIRVVGFPRVEGNYLVTGSNLDACYGILERFLRQEVGMFRQSRK